MPVIRVGPTNQTLPLCTEAKLPCKPVGKDLSISKMPVVGGDPTNQTLPLGTEAKLHSKQVGKVLSRIIDACGWWRSNQSDASIWN